MSSPARRVLALSTLYPNAARPHFGTFVARSLEALAARQDWDVTVINPVGVAPFGLGRYQDLRDAARDGTEHGVSVYRPTFPLIPKLGWRFNPALVTRAVLPMARRLHAQEPFDMLDAQFFYPDGPAIARIAEALDLPFSVKARGADIHYWGSLPASRRMILSAADAADGLLSVCGALADDMAGIGMARETITLHYTGLDRDRFRPLQHDQIRNRLSSELDIALPARGPLLATVGALIPRKGQEFVIRALARLPEAHLLLVGQGEDEAMLRALAAELAVTDRVHFLGGLDHHLLPIVLSASNAMVLPSSSEGLANAWIEALACGTPLVITDAGGAREVVTESGAGRIVARDADAITTAITQLLAQPPARADVAATAARFSWEANGAALAEHYERLLEARAR